MGDDQVGLVLADRLANRHIPDTIVTRTETPGSDLAAEAGSDVELLVLVDAAPADRDHPAGAFEWLDYFDNSSALFERKQGGTHGLGVCSGLKLADALGQLPRDVWICVVFGCDFQRGLELSEPVAAVLDTVVEGIEHRIRQWVHNHPGANAPKSHL